MEIQIKVSPGDAIPTIDKVTAALGKAEDKGPKVGAAISRGMKDASTAAAAAIEPFKALTAQFEREAQMLERLNGPMKRLGEDLQN